jgi:hypothetical protein
MLVRIKFLEARLPAAVYQPRRCTGDIVWGQALISRLSESLPLSSAPMVRRPRVLAPQVLYHVIVRGSQRHVTFRTSSDYEAYLERLAKTIKI